MGKFVEALFRYKWLLILPPLLITIIVTPVAIMTAPLVYVSWASIWVDKPTYLVYSDNWNQWASPAQNQTARLTELLKTQSFVVDVAKRTSLSSLTTTAKGLDRVQTTITQGLGVYPSGSHLVTIYFRAETPQVAYQMLTAIVDAFNDNMTTDQVNQSSLATSFYTDQLQQAQDELTKNSNDMRTYIQSNPRLIGLGSPNSSVSLDALAATDPTLAQLSSQVKAQQERVGQIRQALQSSEFQASASVEGQQLGFQIVDAPTLPSTGGRDLKKRIVFPAAAAVVGILISIITLVLLMAGDRSVRSEADLPPSLRVLGSVPKLRLNRIPKGLGADSTRRAIGFIAGAALPAPRGSK